MNAAGIVAMLDEIGAQISREWIYFEVIIVNLLNIASLVVLKFLLYNDKSVLRLNTRSSCKRREYL